MFLQDNTTRKSVLLVDDDRYVIELYADAFRNGGLYTETAIGAADALKKIKAKQYSAIIVDAKMVAVDGLELIEMVKNDNLAKDSIFIVLTNDSDPDKINKAKALGVVMYLTKVSTLPVEAVKKVIQALEAKAHL